MRRIRWAAALCLLPLVAACTDDDSDSNDSTTTTQEATTTRAPATTVAASTTATTTTGSGGTTTSATSTTSASGTSGPSTSAGVTSTTLCEAPTNIAPVIVDFPQKLSSLYGDDMDTGGHLCFERVVLSFAGAGEPPGYSVQYMPDPLVLASSGEPTELRGNANLIIQVGSWMGPEGAFTGETQMFPLNVDKIDEVKLIDNFESMMVWGVGLDAERPFEVFTLPDPFRIVVDIAAT